MNACVICVNKSFYKITKVKDLSDLSSELECVFNAALAPDKVPTGPMYGRFFRFFNSPIFNLFSNFIWEGKYIQKDECSDESNTFLGWNVFRFFRRPIFPFLFSLKPIPLNLAPGEYNNGENALVIDYSEDVKEKCPNYRHFLDEPNETKNMTNIKTEERNRTKEEPIAIHPYLDVLRFVGKQEDGGSIFLGKAYMKDLFREDKQAATITYWSVISYDENVMKEFTHGDSLPPLKETFKYMHPGIVDFPLRQLPFDNLLTTPIRTVSDVIQGSLRIGREMFLYFQDVSRNGLRRHPRRFRNAYNADKKPGRNWRGRG